MRGRYRLAMAEAVDKLEGSEQAKERMKVIVATLTGQCRLQEACAQLDISAPRSQPLRQQFLDGGLASLEPGQAGRPAKVPAAAERRVQELEAQLAALRVEHQAAQVRAEIGAILPQMSQQAADPKKNASAGEETARPAPWSADDHLKGLGIYRPRGHDGASERSGPRGPARQQEQRKLEQQVRQDVVEFTIQTRAQGWPWDMLAEMLRLAARTLRHWCQPVRQLPLNLGLLGRPTQRAALPVRRDLLEVLEELGPGVSVADLRHQFPEMGRRELEDFLARYRRLWRWRHTAAVPVLHWPQLGRVWAMDFTETPVPIDGRYRYLLAVRDLASGQQLLAWPMTNTTAAAVRPALAWLFATCGAPLLLKMANGSAFRAEAAQDYLREWGVTSLFSPPRMPRYNGSIEAGIGPLKMRVERLTAHQGHPGVWTFGEVEAARLEANATARPHALNGPTPDEAWTARYLVSAAERSHFPATVESYRAAELAQVIGEGSGTMPGADGDQLWTQEEFVGEDRRAGRRALEACGYLLFSRRRIHLPIPGKKPARDS